MKWYDDLSRKWRHVVDQCLHFGAGATLSAFLGPVVSILVAVGREAWQNWGDEDNDYLDMGLDVLFWGLGAILMSLVF